MLCRLSLCLMSVLLAAQAHNLTCHEKTTTVAATENNCPGVKDYCYIIIGKDNAVIEQGCEPQSAKTDYTVDFGGCQQATPDLKVCICNQTKCNTPHTFKAADAKKAGVECVLREKTEYPNETKAYCGQGSVCVVAQLQDKSVYQGCVTKEECQSAQITDTCSSDDTEIKLKRTSKTSSEAEAQAASKVCCCNEANCNTQDKVVETAVTDSETLTPYKPETSDETENTDEDSSQTKDEPSDTPKPSYAGHMAAGVTSLAATILGISLLV